MTTLWSLALLGAAALNADMTPAVIQAPDSPVRLDRAHVLTPSDTPPILIYEATNISPDELEQFTVIAFVFSADGRLKARQVAPARRTLEAKGAKYSTMVLDGSPIDPTDLIVIGVNQAQKAGTETWWRVDLQPLAQDAARRGPQPSADDKRRPAAR